MARPRIELDWLEIEKLCALHCTQEEIADFCECSLDTLERDCLRQKEMSFAEFFAQKRGKGKISLRRKQWALAMEGDRTMLVWLGKQYLGQSDKTENHSSVAISRPLKDEDDSVLDSILRTDE